MDKNIQSLWIDALRSGDYEQGRGQLRSGDDKFCCLGVLCDLYVKNADDAREWREGSGYFSIEGTAAVLPPSVKEWAEMPKHSEGQGMFEGADGDVYDLINMNDAEKKSFEEIADVLEGNMNMENN